MFKPLLLQFTGKNWNEVCAALPAEDRQLGRHGNYFVRLRGDGLVPMMMHLQPGDWIFSFEPGELDLGPEKMAAWLSQMFAVAYADYAEAANG